MDLGELIEKSQKRNCKECGEVFLSDEQGSALQKYADHSVQHQPTPAQWTEAYRKIQAAKERKRAADAIHL